jgi:methylenetetrahydrofolate reductase (NADPH)
MHVVDLWKSNPKPTLAYEFFPSKTEKGALNLDQTLAALLPLQPDIVHVTFGAGGSTREGSHQLASRLVREYRKPVITYFAGFGLGPEEITRVLDAYQSLGVENVLVVRGDAPKQEGFRPHPASMRYAGDLLTFIRSRYSFCTGVAGYPEGHPLAPDLAFDMDVLKRKVDGGAEFIITNYFYENHFFFAFMERCAQAGIRVPIIPGIMPIFNSKLLPIMAKNCGASVPPSVCRDLEKYPEEESADVTAYGVAYAYRQCEELLRTGVPGLLLYTMNRGDPSRSIVSQLRAAALV